MALWAPGVWWLGLGHRRGAREGLGPPRAEGPIPRCPHHCGSPTRCVASVLSSPRGPGAALLWRVGVTLAPGAHNSGRFWTLPLFSSGPPLPGAPAWRGCCCILGAGRVGQWTVLDSEAELPEPAWGVKTPVQAPSCCPHPREGLCRPSAPGTNGEGVWLLWWRLDSGVADLSLERPFSCLPPPQEGARLSQPSGWRGLTTRGCPGCRGRAGRPWQAGGRGLAFLHLLNKCPVARQHSWGSWVAGSRPHRAGARGQHPLRAAGPCACRRGDQVSCAEVCVHL